MHAMTPEDTKAPERFSLSRWSRRKREAAQGAPAAPAAAEASPAIPVATQASAAIVSGDAAAMPAQSAVTRPAAGAPAAAEPLPPVDSLTFDSDFAAFMQPKVDEGTKRAALKKLFSNEHFNVMDGLDIYVGDYTQPDPMPEGMLDKLAKVYEAIKPFDNAPAATDAAAVPQVAADARAGDVPVAEDAQVGDSPTATDGAPKDADAPALPDAAAADVPPPAAPVAATTTRVPVPSGPPKSA
jgi:hypothetical protein